MTMLQCVPAAGPEVGDGPGRHPFDVLLPATLAALAPLCPRQQHVPTPFAERIAEGLPGTRLRAAHYVLGDGALDEGASAGELRATIIRGPKVHIVSVMIYPNMTGLPVFAGQTVCFGPRLHVGLVDLHLPVPAAGTSWLGGLHHTRRAVEHLLPLDIDPPAWMAGVCSPAFLLIRHMDMTECASTWTGGWTAYAAAWTRLLHTSRADARPAGDPAALDGYKAHHRDNSPGLTFMRKVFGTQWTDQYMGNFMYKHAGQINSAELG